MIWRGNIGLTLVMVPLAAIVALPFYYILVNTFMN